MVGEERKLLSLSNFMMGLCRIIIIAILAYGCVYIVGYISEYFEFYPSFINKSGVELIPHTTKGRVLLGFAVAPVALIIAGLIWILVLLTCLFGKW